MFFVAADSSLVEADFVDREDFVDDGKKLEKLFIAVMDHATSEDDFGLLFFGLEEVFGDVVEEAFGSVFDALADGAGVDDNFVGRFP